MESDKFELVWVTNRRLSADFFADVRRVAQGGRADKILLRESDLPEREYEILARKMLAIIAGCGARLVVHTYADAAIRLGVRELHLPFAKFVEMRAKRQTRLAANFSDEALPKTRKFETYGARAACGSNLIGANLGEFDGRCESSSKIESEPNFTESSLLKIYKTPDDKDISRGDLRSNSANFAKVKDACSAKNIGEREENLSAKFKIGVSVHSLGQALLAQELGADYVVAGHVFDTPSHALERGRGLSFLEQICASLSIKTYAIGGINFKNLSSIKDAGAAGAYMMRGFLD